MTCKYCRGRGYYNDYDGDPVLCVYCEYIAVQQKYDEMQSQVEDCNPGYDMSCGRCKACMRTAHKALEQQTDWDLF